MIEDLLRKVDKIYIAYGVTDFRLRTPSLCRLVENKSKVSPYKHEAFDSPSYLALTHNL